MAHRIVSKIDLDDFIYYQRVIGKKRKREALFKLALVITIVLAAVIISYIIGTMLALGPYFMILLTLLMALAFVYPASILLYRNNVKGLFDDDRHMFRKKTYVIDDDGFNEITENSNCHFDWTAIDRIEQSKKHLYVFIDRFQAYIIDKSGFPDKKSANDFFNFASNKLKNN